MKKAIPIAAVAIALAVILVFAIFRQTQAYGYHDIADDEPFLGEIGISLDNLKDHTVETQTLDAPVERLFRIEVTEVKAVGTMNFLFVLESDNGEDVVLYDFSAMGFPYENEIAVTIPAGRSEIRMAGGCKTVTLRIVMSQPE